MADPINVKEFKYEDTYFDWYYGSTTLYFTGPKKYLPEKYQDEADSMTISLEYLGDNRNEITAMASPTANDSDYDWYDIELSETDTNYLLKMVSSDFPCVLVCKENWSRNDYR